jgi:CubicO group peptidase (beta-lactamase class C family)
LGGDYSSANALHPRKLRQAARRDGVAAHCSSEGCDTLSEEGIHMRLQQRMMAFSALAVLAGVAASPGWLRAWQADRFAAVPARMQEFVDKGEAAGVVTLIATKDKILHLGAVGKTDLARDRKMQTDDIFWIASMSKPVTSVCIAILADDGKLSFDDPLAKHLPEFAGVMVSQNGETVKPSRPPTLRDVMTHSSGLGEMTTREPHLTLAETSRKLAQQPLRFQPGSRFAYSTAGIDVLGRVVEAVSGVPYDEFLQKRVLDPLGMKDTSFWIAPAKEARWAHSYRWNAAAGKLEETTIPYLYNTAVTDRQRPPLGGAGLFSTAGDIARFYQMMLHKGTLNGKRILKPETVAEMTRKQTGELVARPGMPWGLGFCVVEDPTKMAANSPLSPNSFGHGGAFSTQSWADPVKNLIWIVMFERDGKGNPDNSDVRIAFQEAAAKGLGE